MPVDEPEINNARRERSEASAARKGNFCAANEAGVALCHCFILVRRDKAMYACYSEASIALATV